MRVQKAKMFPSAIHKHYIMMLQELSRKVQVEQEEFTKYLEENALHFAEDYAHIHPEAKRYVQVCFRHEIVLKKY